eukprot:UN27637
MFVLFSSAWILNIQTAFIVFFTAESECLPDGPHWHYSFFLTISSVTVNISSIIAVFLFQRYTSYWYARNAILLPCLLIMVAGVIDVIIVKRWNIAYGISDIIMYFVGDNVSYNLAIGLMGVPTTILLTRICPEHLETTMFSISSSVANFGMMIAGVWGSMLIKIT